MVSSWYITISLAVRFSFLFEIFDGTRSFKILTEASNCFCLFSILATFEVMNVCSASSLLSILTKPSFRSCFISYFGHSLLEWHYFWFSKTTFDILKFGDYWTQNRKFQWNLSKKLTRIDATTLFDLLGRSEIKQLCSMCLSKLFAQIWNRFTVIGKMDLQTRVKFSFRLTPLGVVSAMTSFSLHFSAKWFQNMPVPHLFLNIIINEHLGCPHARKKVEVMASETNILHCFSLVFSRFGVV